MILSEIETALQDRGWVSTELPSLRPIFAARDALLGYLREKHLPRLSRLDDYHQFVADRERHIAILFDLSNWYWDQAVGRTIIAANMDFFRRLVGADLHVQNRPYLRAVRPGNTEDAAPMHRDTYYGASAYEVSVFVPFTDVSAANAMRVISGSHRAPDSDYPYEQRVSPDVAIRSPKHKLGFPYAPRLLDPLLDEKAVPVPLKVGEVLIFGLSLVHGGGVNNGDRTRFSSDIRVVNSLAPVNLNRGVDDAYYVPLCSSVTTRVASDYEATKETAK